MESDLPAVLERDEWFGTMPVERRSLLLAAGRPQAIPAGGCVYRSGDKSSGLWAILSGQIRLTGLPEDGSEFLVRILKPGSWFGELSTLDGRPRPQEAVAFEPSTLLQINQMKFDELAFHEPLLFRDIALLICRNQRRALAFIAHSSAPIRVRLAKALLGALGAAGHQSIKIRQAELAAVVGVSRQTLNKELKILESAGLIDVKYAELVVKDAVGLRAIHDD